jgi:hypothetical protein
LSEISSSSTARSVRLPADYYSAPVSEIRPVFPRWVPLGCGSASIVFLVLLFAAGGWIQQGGLEWLMDFALGMMQTEMEAMFDKDVTDADKHALSEAMTSFRANIKTDKVPLLKVSPVIEKISPATADKHLSHAEVTSLVETIRQANVPKAPKTRAAS